MGFEVRDVFDTMNAVQERVDRRVGFGAMAMCAVAAVGGLFAWTQWGVAGVVLVASGLLLAVVGGVVWLLYFYRCPECAALLRIEETGAGRDNRIRHYCKNCDVVWSSLSWGSAGDP